MGGGGGTGLYPNIEKPVKFHDCGSISLLASHLANVQIVLALFHFLVHVKNRGRAHCIQHQAIRIRGFSHLENLNNQRAIIK